MGYEWKSSHVTVGSLPKVHLEANSSEFKTLSHRNIVFMLLHHHKSSPILKNKDMSFAVVQKKMLQARERLVPHPIPAPPSKQKVSDRKSSVKSLGKK